MGGWGGEVEGMPGTLGTAEKSGEAIECNRSVLNGFINLIQLCAALVY